MKGLMKLLGCGLLLVTGQALAQTVEYIHTDALGSPVAITDALGNVVEREVYQPYGAPMVHGPRDSPGFTGHVEDIATGLIYMQQRYYDSAVGSFLSTDPVNAYAGTSSLFNRYRYAEGNPYKFSDPDGRCAAQTGSRICSGGESFSMQYGGSGSGGGGVITRGAYTTAHNGRNRGDDSISKVSPTGTSNATDENLNAVMDKLGIRPPTGVVVKTGDTGVASGMTDNLSGSPDVTIGQNGFDNGLIEAGNIIRHEINHAIQFQQNGNITGYQDLYMREIGAHMFNIANPIPGTPKTNLQTRQKWVDGYYNQLSPENKAAVDSGIYHGK